MCLIGYLDEEEALMFDASKRIGLWILIPILALLLLAPIRDRGLQMNAYAFSEDYESVDIFVSIYSDTEMPRSVSQTDVDSAIKRAIQLYHRAVNDLYTSFQRDNDTYEFAISVFQNKSNIKNVRICALYLERSTT